MLMSYDKEYLAYLTKNTNSSIFQYEILYPIFTNHLNFPGINTNKLIYQDLSLFNGVSDLIDRSITLPGKIYVQSLLSFPTNNLQILTKRQQEIRSLSNDTNMQWYLQHIAQSGDLDVLLELYSPPSTNARITEVLFNRDYLNRLNSNSTLLHWSNNLTIIGMPLLTLFSPLISILLPMLIMKFYYGWDISWMYLLSWIYKSLKQYFLSQANIFAQFGHLGTGLSILWNMLFIYSFFTTCQESWNKYKIIAEVHGKLVRIARLVKGVGNMYYHPNFQDRRIEKSLAIIKEILIQSGAWEAESGIFSHRGTILVAYQKLQQPEIQKYVNDLIYFIGWVDGSLGLNKLLTHSQFTFARYLTGKESPEINIKGLWHPAIVPPIFNDLTTTQNIILTGPNQGGKSTFIKALTLNLWFGQTIGLANAQLCEFTPFGAIHSYIEISDLVGHESLFEAEMNRMKEYLDFLKNRDLLSFAVIDEIFTSTNFQEGLAAALAVGKELSNYPKNLCILTTHYQELTILEQSTGAYQNYQVMIQRDPIDPTDITFLYKIKPGISNERIALDLLSNRGFTGNIIEDAQQYLRRNLRFPL